MPTKSFEDRLARLEQVAESLKDGKIPLEEAIALFEEGSKLAKTLEKELARVERKVQVLSGEERKPANRCSGSSPSWTLTRPKRTGDHSGARARYRSPSGSVTVSPSDAPTSVKAPRGSSRA